ncbi:MAG: efflux RND transporter permease subunit [Planctomycetes bacterium]|nr:efflux RND transporter permease subunit [Planctomycetota bacterium]
MLSWIVATALTRRSIVFGIAALLIVGGIQAIRQTPIDIFPEFAPPLVEVQTEAPGFSAEEVETLVSMPMEAALNGVPFLKTIRSKSVLGLSAVTLIFNENTDVMQARQLVQERVMNVQGRLPATAHASTILPPFSSLSRILKIGISSPTRSREELSVLVRSVVLPRLLAVPGVSNVAVWGERLPQLQVQVDPDRLGAAGVTLPEIVAAARGAVASGGGGIVDTSSQRLAARVVPGVTSAKDLGAAAVRYAPGGVAPVRLRDVTDVFEAPGPPIGDATFNGAPGLLLIAEKQPWSNTLDVTRGIEAELAALAPTLGDAVVDSTIFRPASFVERALRNLTHAVLVGCGLVAALLLLFLFDVRRAVISLTAIPLSVLGALVVLCLRGHVIDTMVLTGLVLALGEVVDDAIIDVENIGRRLREERAKERPRSAFRVVLAASLEVRSPVVIASLIVTLVFVPVLFIGGTAGAFFRPLAVSYMLAVGSSLAVALTVTPALCLVLLGRRKERRESPIADWFRTVYERLLPRLVRRPVLAGATLVVLAGGASLALPSFGEDLMPKFHETDFLMHWILEPGASLDEVRRSVERLEGELLGIPGVRNCASHIGRAELGDEPVGANFAEVWLSIEETADVSALLHQIEERIKSYPGIQRDVLTYLTERIEEVLTGAGASTVLRIYGPDLHRLRTAAQSAREAVARIPGVKSARVESQVEVPQIEVRPRPEDLARLGVTATALSEVVDLMLRGVVVGEVVREQQVLPVVVRGLQRLPNHPLAIADAKLVGSGGMVRVGDVADVVVAPAPNVIQREKASRRIDVLLDVEDGALGEVTRGVEDYVRATDFGPQSHAVVIGEHSERARARTRLIALSAVAVLAILLLLYSDFGSLRPALLVLFTLPFALIGGVFGALISGATLSMGSLIGFVAVLGITARNGILLVSRWLALEQESGQPINAALIVKGGSERVLPILLTAMATSVALLPLVIARDKPGHEIEQPMAVVILGGLVTSTLLNLFVLPALYLRWSESRSRGLAPARTRS